MHIYIYIERERDRQRQRQRQRQTERYKDRQMQPLILKIHQLHGDTIGLVLIHGNQVTVSH